MKLNFVLHCVPLRAIAKFIVLPIVLRCILQCVSSASCKTIVHRALIIIILLLLFVASSKNKISPEMARNKVMNIVQRCLANLYDSRLSCFWHYALVGSIFAIISLFLASIYVDIHIATQWRTATSLVEIQS